MLGFTRQEQKFALFLLVSFVVGLSISLFKRNDDKKGEEGWTAERDSLFARFETLSMAGGHEKSNLLQSPYQQAKRNSGFRVDKKSLVGKVNINSADIETLQSLPGIGPSMAQRIIDYRKSFGPFRTIEDLTKIKGIGPKTFDKLKKAVTINSKE